MLFRSLLSFSVLAGVTLAASTTSGTSHDLALLQAQLKEAEYQAAKAARLVRRARTYGSSSAAKHKQAVFSRRQQRWDAAVDQIEAEIESLGGQTSATTAAAPTKSTSVPPTMTSSAQSTTSSAAAAPTSSLKSKKGICFNEAKLTRNINAAWSYNWGMKRDATLVEGTDFVPMLWSDNVGDWMEEAPKQIAAGATHLLGFNEPDLDTQANMTVPESVAAWKKYMSPFSDQAKLVSPAVTNGGYPMGVTYLEWFFGNCTQCYHETEAIALHWYDSALNEPYFTNYLIEAHEKFSRPIWLTEFAGSGSVAEQTAFFDKVIPWMDEQPWIHRYAGFGDFAGTFVNEDGSVTKLGQAYNDA
ncbi:hypothetical protein JCM6882_002751 [Rhodosporidiobolus microsporus]